MVEARKINTTLAKTAKPAPAAAAKPAQGRQGAAAAASGGAAARSTSMSRVKGAQRDNYECPVCLRLCAQPVITPCKHMLCFDCNKELIKKGMTCPMCRAHFDKLFIPQVDRELQEEIAAAMGK